MKHFGTVTPEQRRLIHELMFQESPYVISDELKDRFIDSGKLLEYRRGEAICHAGKVNTSVYMVVEGIIRRWYWDGKNEKTDSFGTAGSIFLSFHGYQAGEPGGDNYEACCTTRVLRILRPDFDRLLADNHDFALWMLRYSFMEFYFIERKRDVIQGSALERYESLVEHRPEILRHVLLKNIASYLGVSPQYLSVLRRRLCRR